MPLSKYTEDVSLAETIRGEHLTFDAGAILFEPDSDDDCVYEIISGIAKAYTLNDRGEEIVHLLYGQYNIFPVTWLINKRRLEVYISALDTIEVVRYSKDDFAKAMTSNSEFALKVTARIIMQLNLYAATVDNLEYKFASQRVAYRLLFIGHRFGKVVGNAVVLPPFTNEDIGRSINLSRESVNRTMAKFIRLKLIEIKRGRIRLIDQMGLRQEVSKKKTALFIDDFIRQQS